MVPATGGGFGVGPVSRGGTGARSLTEAADSREAVIAGFSGAAPLTLTSLERSTNPPGSRAGGGRWASHIYLLSKTHRASRGKAGPIDFPVLPASRGGFGPSRAELSRVFPSFVRIRPRATEVGTDPIDLKPQDLRRVMSAAHGSQATHHAKSPVSIPFVVVASILIGIGLASAALWLVYFNWLLFLGFVPLVVGALMLFSPRAGAEKANGKPTG